MTRTQKGEVLEALTKKLSESDFFYIADASTLTVEETNELRAAAHEAGVTIQVAKNTLVRKALESIAAEKNTEGLYEALKGPTALMFTENAKAPAALIKEFRKTHEKPVLKAAYIDTAIYIGDDQVEALSQIKSKEELVGDIIMLLQSPVKNVLGSLQSAGQTISGLLKTLEERGA